MFINAVYYTNWSAYDKVFPSSLRHGVISHLLYAFAWVKEDGTVHLSDEQVDLRTPVDGKVGCIRAFAALKEKHSHLKLLLSIGGAGEGSKKLKHVAAHPLARVLFAVSARKIVDAHGLDGVDVDWEHPENADQGRDYSLLLDAVRRVMPSPKYLVTTALPAGQWALQHINLSLIQNYVDFINLMAYDFSGPWVETTGHQAQFRAPLHPHSDAAKLSGESAVGYMISRGVPREKIVLGIPLYGRSFLGATGIGQKYKGHGGHGGTFAYKALPRPGSDEMVHANLGAAFCVGGDGGFVTYDNPQTVRMKATYVATAGLGGLFYWHGANDGDDERSLILEGFRSLHA